MSKKWLDVIKLVQRGTFQKKYFYVFVGGGIWQILNFEVLIQLIDVHMTYFTILSLTYFQKILKREKQ